MRQTSKDILLNKKSFTVTIYHVIPFLRVEFNLIVCEPTKKCNNGYVLCCLIRLFSIHHDNA